MEQLNPIAKTLTQEAASSSPQLKLVCELLATVLKYDRFEAAAAAFVTEVAIRLKCDRVSLGLVRRRRVRIHAMSHTASIGKRTNLIRAIEAAMDEVLDQATVVNFPQAGEVANTDFRITRMHSQLAGHHGSGSICSVPLALNGEVLGVLTLERPADVPFDARDVELCEATANLAGPLLHLRRRDERSLAARLGESIGQLFRYIFELRHLGWKFGAIAAMLVVHFLWTVEVDYRISAKTVLEGSKQLAAVAPFDGYISDAPSRAGDLVRQGDVLCVLDDREIKLELQKWKSQHQQLSRQYEQAMADLDAVQVKIITAQIDQAKPQLELIESRLSRTRVTAPIDGVVVSGDLSQSIGAPAERGDVLFEIAPLESFRLVLEVDEADVADVTPHQEGHVLLAAFPGEALPFKIQTITPISMAREGHNYFRVEAKVDVTRPEQLRPGMEGVGKIAIGRRSLVWIWTHKAVDWLQVTLWAWLP